MLQQDEEDGLCKSHCLKSPGVYLAPYELQVSNT